MIITSDLQLRLLDIRDSRTVRDLIIALDRVRSPYKIESISFSDIYQVIDKNIKFVYMQQCKPGHFAFLFFDGEYFPGAKCGIAFVEFI